MSIQCAKGSPLPLLASQDVNRRTYNVKENRIAKLFAGVLKVPTSSFGMTQFKARSQVGEAAGDFGAAAERSLQGRTRVPDPRPPGSPGPTIAQVNAMLDRLAAAEGDLAQRAVVLELLQQLTPREHKWLLRIVLKDLKARIRHESFLSEFHEVSPLWLSVAWRNALQPQKIVAAMNTPTRTPLVSGATCWSGALCSLLGRFTTAATTSLPSAPPTTFVGLPQSCSTQVSSSEPRSTPCCAGDSMPAGTW